jgi:hypothetical protein
MSTTPMKRFLSLDGQIKINANPVLYRPPEKVDFLMKFISS